MLVVHGNVDVEDGDGVCMGIVLDTVWNMNNRIST